MHTALCAACCVASPKPCWRHCQPSRDKATIVCCCDSVHAGDTLAILGCNVGVLVLRNVLDYATSDDALQQTSICCALCLGSPLRGIVGLLDWHVNGAPVTSAAPARSLSDTRCAEPDAARDNRGATAAS